MSMRICSAVLLPLSLAACGGSDQTSLSNAEAQQDAAAADNGRIVCAVAGSDDFQRDCTLDRTETDKGVILTIHQPDGGFHKLRIADNGRGVVAADGAEAAKVTVIGDHEIEVAIGGARYRLPATIGPVKS